MNRICRSEINKLAKDIYTLTYAPTAALEAERTAQMAKGRKQSLRLLTAIETELRARQANGGKRPSMEDMLG